VKNLYKYINRKAQRKIVGKHNRLWALRCFFVTRGPGSIVCGAVIAHFLTAK